MLRRNTPHPQAKSNSQDMILLLFINNISIINALINYFCRKFILLAFTRKHDEVIGIKHL